MDPIATANLKLSANRGTARLWLEGAKLAAAGFNRYDSYAVVVIDCTATRVSGIPAIKIIHESFHSSYFEPVTGTGKVAGRERNGKALPIIDRHVSQWTALIGTHRLAVQYFPGMVVITPERIS
jgi:hypothetical protein